MTPKFVLWLAALCIYITFSLADKPCNIFLDKVLNEMKADKAFFQEPYEIPDGQKSFGIYELEFGHVYGLNTLHRVHDVVLQKKSDRSMKVYLGAGELQLKSSVKRKFLSFGKSANVDAYVPFVTMELDVVYKSDGTDPQIKNFKVDEVKGLSVKVSGAGFLKDLVLNAFISAFGRFFKNTVKNTVEYEVKRFVKNKVKDFTIPLECLNDAWD